MIAISRYKFGAFSLVLCLASFLCLWQLGASSISISDESLHVKVTQEIFQKGNWWNTTISGTPYYSKPPFKMWMACIPLYLFGESNLSYRLLDGLLGVASCVALAWFAWLLYRSFWGAVLAPLALLSNYHFLFGAHGVRRATQDAMLIFLTLLVYIFAWRLWHNQLGRSKWDALGVGLGTACAMLTKSLAGAIPFGLAMIFVLLSADTRKHLVGNGSILWICLLAILIPVSAFYLPHLIFTDGYYALAVQGEIVNRVQNGYHNANRISYYFRQLLNGSYGPICALILGSITFLMTKSWKSPEGRFLLVTILVPLCVFTIIPSRLAWYLSAAYPAIAILCLFPWVLSLEGREFWHRWSLVLCRILTIFVVAVHLIGFTKRNLRPLQRTEFELAIEAVREGTDAPLYVHGPGLRMEHPHYNRVEKIYLANLRERVHIFASFDELPPPQSKFIVLLPSTESERLIKLQRPLSYAKLPPAHHGKPPLMLLSFGLSLNGSIFKESRVASKNP